MCVFTFTLHLACVLLLHYITFTVCITFTFQTTFTLYLLGILSIMSVYYVCMMYIQHSLYIDEHLNACQKRTVISEYNLRTWITMDCINQACPYETETTAGDITVSM